MNQEPERRRIAILSPFIEWNAILSFGIEVLADRLARHRLG